MEEKINETIINAETIDVLYNMMECILTKEQKKCKNCKCVDVCSLLTEAVFVCRTKKLKEHQSCLATRPTTESSD